jgi:hypothetical protein
MGSEWVLMLICGVWNMSVRYNSIMKAYERGRASMTSRESP